MAVGVKAPAPADAQARARTLVAEYQHWLHQTKSTLPVALKLRRTLAQIYRSKGERHQMASYYSADFAIDVGASLAQAG
jgi:hypothetical protein